MISTKVEFPEVDTVDSKVLVNNSAIKFSTEKSIVNWLYQCPVLGEPEENMSNSCLASLSTKQNSITETINKQLWISSTKPLIIQAALALMINGDISTKPVYRSLKADVDEIRQED